MPVAWLRLRPPHGISAAGVPRRPHVRAGRGPRRRRLRRRRGRAAARADRRRRRGRDDGQLGCQPRLRHGGPLQPRARGCHAPPGGGGQPHLRRHPPRGRGVLRGVGVREAHRAAGRVLRDRRPRLHQPAHRALRRQGRSGPRARPLRAGAVQGARARGLPGRRPLGRVRRRRRLLQDPAAGLGPCRADHAGPQARRARTPGRPPGHARRGPGAARRRRGRVTAYRAPPRPGDQPARRGGHGRLRPPGRRPPARGHRRPRRPLRHGRRHRPGRGARRPGAHHLQGQGADLRPPSARLRRARPQRHPGGQLAHERVRPARRVRRQLLEPHRHRRLQADHPGRLRPHGPRAVPPGHRAGARPRGRHRRPAARRSCPPRPSASTSAPTSPPAGRSGAPRSSGDSPTTAAAGSARRRSSPP